MNPSRVISVLTASVTSCKKQNPAIAAGSAIKMPAVRGSLVDTVFLSLQMPWIQELPTGDTLIQTSWRSPLQLQSSKC